VETRLPHLLVDGSNVVHAWPELRSDLRRAKEVAKARLVERLRPLHDAAGWRVTVVFDGRGAELAIDRPGPEATFSVLHTPAGVTADDVIERLVANAAEPGAITVATGDRAELSTVAAAGAATLSPEDLREWADRAVTSQSEQVGRHNQANTSAWQRKGKR
jgi:predicted RNA-binding protein with PIN domain